MKSLLLDFQGVALMLVLAVVVYFGGGHFGAQFLALMLVFLIASVVATKYGFEDKREWGIYEHERSWENVLANGLIPAACALFSPSLGIGAYLGSLAAITADKFGSELGVLSSDPISLFTFKTVKRGTSGAMSVFGTLMSFDGALLIGASAFFLFPSRIDAWKIVLIALIGFAGSIVDSIFGVLEERGIGTKATTNIICAMTGAILGFLLLS